MKSSTHPEDDLRWRSYGRTELPGVLAGYERPALSEGSLERSLSTGEGIAFGFTRNSKPQRREHFVPDIIVVDDRSSAEVFSWLRTYAPETFPISQFARVVSLSDWHSLFDPRNQSRSSGNSEAKWASVVLGEVLAQGDYDSDLGALPLSWALSCFSTSIARVSSLYGDQSRALRPCIERLRTLEADPRFARRAVPMDGLELIWQVLGSWNERALSFADPGEMVQKLFRDFSGSRLLREQMGHDYPYVDLTSDSPFFSDSIELRVRAFHNLVGQLEPFKAGLHRSQSFADILIAAAAFLVGRGTSHLFLLQRVMKRWPCAFPWFGLMAAFADPKSFDVPWFRAQKGVERLLRASSDLIDVSTADLCWPEYAWISKTIPNNRAFNDLPKMFPRVISIEVLPNSVCQLRTVSTPTAAESETGRHLREAAERREAERRAELRKHLDDVVNSAKRARSLLDGPVETGFYQPSLLPEERTSSYDVERRSRRAPKNPDKK